MSTHIILASGSEIRAQLLRNAGVKFHIEPVRVDEETMRNSMVAEGAKPRDIADALAEMKARKCSSKNPSALVIGCDQVLEHKDEILGKPNSPEDAREQLTRLRSDRHSLLSAVVIYENALPIWRHVAQVRLRMRAFSDEYLNAYLDRNWDSIRHAVGCYKLEEEGVRLFSRIDGDYFSVLGMPLLELLSYLTLRGDLET